MKYQSVIEIPFKKAFKQFPQAFNSIPKSILNNLLYDDRYICRIDLNSMSLEIGFSSDSWLLKPSE